MFNDKTNLNIVRIGSDITYSSLKEIGNRILNAFRGLIVEYRLSHYNSPDVESVDAYLLTMILHSEYGGHTLGITDADLKTHDQDEFYNSIFGGKNPQNDVAVVSTKKLSPDAWDSEAAYDLYLTRTLKVAVHELGHNFGLTDHASYKVSAGGSLCPMSKGEFNKFGSLGYVRAIIDGRGLEFCSECCFFLNHLYARRTPSPGMLKDNVSQHPAC
jgi:predicted Zn-dependent protease